MPTRQYALTYFNQNIVTKVKTGLLGQWTIEFPSGSIVCTSSKGPKPPQSLVGKQLRYVGYDSEISLVFSDGTEVTLDYGKYVVRHDAVDGDIQPETADTSHADALPPDPSDDRVADAPVNPPEPTRKGRLQKLFGRGNL